MIGWFVTIGASFLALAVLVLLAVKFFGDFISIRGLSLPRRMVLQGMASLLGCAVTPSAFAATAKSCKLTERDIIGPFYRFGAPYQTKLAGPNEDRRERFLTGEELERLGATIVEAETSGIPWVVDQTKLHAKHLPTPTNRFTKINQFAAAALRLLLFTGCRLREILHLRWEHVDLERGLLFLPDSKTGRKTVILNAPAVEILAQLQKIGPYVVPGDDPEKPRPDLHRPWRAIRKRAGLEGVRLHDLRHTYASFGAGSGLGLPIIGRLLGHTQASTTARYAHLDNDPLRRASETIGGRIAEALKGNKTAAVIPIRRSA